MMSADQIGEARLSPSPSPSSSQLRQSNVLPATAMWAVAAGPNPGAGNTFWMLPVIAGGGEGVGGAGGHPMVTTAPGTGPTEAQIWPFATSAAGNTPSIQAPLHFNVSCRDSTCRRRIKISKVAEEICYNWDQW
ncbi:hypothetical protein LINGRAHAP2_LOCUS24368 [Linum grandiflorum]